MTKFHTALFVMAVVGAVMREGDTAFTPTLLDKVITCRGDATDVTLFFESGFNGEAFADGYHSDARCRARDDGASSLTLSIDYNECGVFQNTADQTYMVFVTIAQRQNLIEADDITYLITCDYDIDMAVTISASDVEYSAQHASAGRRFASRCGKAATMTARRHSNFVDIGAPLLLVASLEDASIYQNILLYDCRAFSAADESFQVELVDSAECVNAGLVDDIIQTEAVQKNIGGDSPVEKWIAFRAFKFPDANIVRFRCQAFACFLASDCDDTVSHPASMHDIF
ncbi:PREDICTED: uncharacterized protein LOC106814368 [Priapulus caudatus]|uniref:Uncharacterized protein LOC106814368 n=1 Tax=Priapulus caudatus TaxID=37621 RepID=A0ABM1EPP5_PRICU|nr:PREDICTED: uncharacterized protein LOC106814368 [Priapulus caudatus]